MPHHRSRTMASSHNTEGAVPVVSVSVEPKDSPVLRRRGSKTDIAEPDSRTSAAISKVSMIVSSEDLAERTPIPHSRIDSSDVFFEKYKAGVFLGEGSYGTVTKVKKFATADEWACKEVVKERAGTTALRMLDREIIILKKVFHPHIVALHEVFETADTTYMVMEICNGGSLQEVAVKESGHPALKPLEVSAVTRRLMRAVAYLHDSGIVHRDMKLENVMLKTKGKLDVKICDFGLCAFLSKDQGNMSIVCGTPAYMAPEVLANNGQYSPLCDVWSVGVMLYQMITGKMPFLPRREGDAVLDVIREVPMDLSHPSFRDAQLTDVLKAMLREDPARRLTAKEVLDFGWVSGKSVGSHSGPSDAMAHSGVLDMMLQFAKEEAEAARAETIAEEAAAAAAAAPSPGTADDASSTPLPLTPQTLRANGRETLGRTRHPTTLLRANGKHAEVVERRECSRTGRKALSSPRITSRVDMGTSTQRRGGHPLGRSPGTAGRFGPHDGATNGRGKSRFGGSAPGSPSILGHRSGPPRSDDSPGPSRKPKNVLTVRLPPLNHNRRAQAAQPTNRRSPPKRS
mmetsp:Transcript_10434/g.26782  ORF Transcript_10434/g.26782 Transcript_10434/m.26782 type:complete len:571 (-) Transcript_10434:83-1795(-)